MNRPNFEIQIVEYRQICEIDGAWGADDFRQMLELMEFPVEDGMSDGDLRELCLMALMDREPEGAAAIVLKYRLGNKLSSGQIQNAAQEFADEKLWEEYAELALHESLFSVASLLYAAFPQDFHTPDAVQLTLEIKATNQAATEILAVPLHESLLVRMLADGMTDKSILHRLFDDQLAGSNFPDANSIVWIVSPVDEGINNLNVKTVQIISSCHWLDALKDVKSFKSSAMPDVNLTSSCSVKANS